MSKIEWCDKTINPIVGCSKISEGCQNCYAEKMARRLKGTGHPQYQDVVDENGWTSRLSTDLSVFDRLPKTVSKKVFVCSMSDLFHENLSYDIMADVFDEMIKNYDRHTYMLLTKRPGRMKLFIEEYFSGNPFWKIDLQNIWLGVTTENQAMADERIPVLLQIPAAVRFVSVEPMLESINLEDEHLPICNKTNGPKCEDCHRRLDWVIAGPETGLGARECKPEWIEDLYEQCKVVGVPFFDKCKDYLAREFPSA